MIAVIVGASQPLALRCARTQITDPDVVARIDYSRVARRIIEVDQVGVAVAAPDRCRSPSRRSVGIGECARNCNVEGAPAMTWLKSDAMTPGIDDPFFRPVPLKTQDDASVITIGALVARREVPAVLLSDLTDR